MTGRMTRRLAVPCRPRAGATSPGPDRAPGLQRAYSCPVPWTVVIPVRAPGKTRLRRGPAFARAIALDTIEAAADAAHVVVVTADAELAAASPAPVVLEPAPAGIAAAIELGLPDEGDRAVLLGDVPALQPDELASALSAALAHPAAFAPDADGTGTTLVTARSGSPFVHRFGAGSADLHRGLALYELDVPPMSGLRRDVDLEEHLRALHGRLGPRTSALLSSG
jgi:2-phospho-L-lactate/phosphoenolpyruvate guanylyltransferase